MKVLVYTEQPSPRVAYACRVLLECMLGLQAEATNDWASFCAYSGPRLIYGNAPKPSSLPRLPAAPLLQQEGIQPQGIDICMHQSLPAAFFLPDVAEALLPFDLLSFTFYLCTRYEEYLPYTPDEHGRFPARASLAFQAGFLERPVLQEWAAVFLEQLRHYYPALPDRRPAYSFRPTYDIDMARAYRHRPFPVLLAGAAREVWNGAVHLLSDRLLTLAGQRPDPFDTFAYLQDRHQRYHHRPLYFLLLGDYGRYDKNLPAESPVMRQLITSLGTEGGLGLHPSYRSNGDPAQLSRECQRFSRLAGYPPQRSRQHFLKLRFPATYRALIGAGIQEDYTMGFADAVGFRAGLAVPYPWYDLEKEAECPLAIYPFQLMDGTLRQYMKLSPDEAIGKTRQLIDQVRSAGGYFLPLWHNSSFSAHHGWEGWDRVHEALLQYGQAD